MQKLTTEQYYKKYGESPFAKPIEEPTNSKSTRGFATGLAVGVGKSLGETAVGLGQIGTKFLQPISKGVDRLFGTEGFGLEDSPYVGENLADLQESLQANAPGEGTGKFIGTLAQYLVPSGSIVKGQKALGALASKAPKGLQTIGKVAARFVPEVAGTGAVSAIRSGGDLEESTKEGITAGAFSVGFGALGSLAQKTYFPKLQESVTKALGITGKRSGGQALEETSKKISGLKVLQEYAPDIKVKNVDGKTVPFNPKEATFDTALQAWNNTRKKIYEKYTKLATDTGEDAVVDLSNVVRGLSDSIQQPGLSAFKQPANSLLRDITGSFDDLTSVPVKDAQRFVEQLNKQTVSGFFKGTSDAAASEVNAGTARLIREQLDDLITKSSGVGYQGLRNQYAALKSIEDDLVRRFQQTARQVGGGIPEYMGMFASGDILGSMLSGSGTGLFRGATTGILATLKRALSDKERFLKRSFKLMDEPDANKVFQRIFGASDGSFSKGATPSSGSPLTRFKERIKNTPNKQGGFIKNPLAQTLDTLNPTGGVFTKYTPAQRASMKLGKNMTTLDKTMGKPAGTTVKIYRGTPSTSGKIVPGDFVTTNKQLAQDYAGTGRVVEMKAKLSQILDDITEPLGEEYIYFPQ